MQAPLSLRHRSYYQCFSAPQGFTVLELIICSFLFALITAVSIPDLTHARDRAALKEAIAITEQLTSEAAASAVSTGISASITLSHFDGSLRWQLRHGTHQPSRSVPLARRVHARSARFAAEHESTSAPSLATITYYPSGAASPGALVLTAGSFRCRLVQPLRGALRMEWLQ